MYLNFLHGLALVVAACIPLAAAVKPVDVQGSDFVNTASKDRLQIIGVAYQPGGSSGFKPDSGTDPLSNATLCLRDAALMQQLGINTIRIYNLDPSINHDECVSIFNAVGIYMLIDVNSPLPNQSLNPGDLGSSYNNVYLEHIFTVVEAFKNYPNVIGFFGGNEVMNDIPSGGKVPPYLRAVTRDLKNYIAKNSQRKIPVGYSAADVRPILADSWSYLSCNLNGDKSDMSRIDFFGLNSYSWCGGDATFHSSEYDKLVAQFSNTTIPVFFSEYGCNKVQPRVFDEVQALYGPQMTPVMSGGLVYQWTEDTNDFGLVNATDDGTASLMIDYDNLQNQYNKLDTKALQSGNTTATQLTSPACKTSLIQSGDFSSDFSIPKPPNGVQKLIDNGIQNPPSGKIVPIQSTKVTTPVFDSHGKAISNLAIKQLKDDESNSPSGQDTSGPSGTGTSSSPTPSKSSGASIDAMIPMSGLGFAALIGLLL